MKLMGLQVMQGKSKVSGNAYDAVLLFVDSEDDRVIGVKTNEVWVPREMWDQKVASPPSEAFVGLDVFLSFTQRGRLQDIKFA